MDDVGEVASKESSISDDIGRALHTPVQEKQGTGSIRLDVFEDPLAHAFGKYQSAIEELQEIYRKLEQITVLPHYSGNIVVNKIDGNDYCYYRYWNTRTRAKTAP